MHSVRLMPGRAESCPFLCLAVTVPVERLTIIQEAMGGVKEEIGDSDYERLIATGRALTLDELVELIDSGIASVEAP